MVRARVVWRDTDDPVWDASTMVKPSMRTRGQEFSGKVQQVCVGCSGALGDVRVLFLCGPTPQERNLGFWLRSAVSLRERTRGNEAS